MFPRKEDLAFYANCLQCQNSFSGQNKINVFKYHLLKCLPCMLSVKRLPKKRAMIEKKKKKQEAHRPRFAHLMKTAIAYLQIPCNILPVLPQQLRHKINHTINRSKVILGSSFVHS